MEARVRFLFGDSPRPGPVIYWMQAAQRIEYNYALDFAIQEARRRKESLQVVFVLTTYPEANIRHYWFMWQGLEELCAAFSALGIAFTILAGDPVSLLTSITEKAGLLVTDRAYLRVPRAWRTEISRRIAVPFAEVETEVVVPIDRVSLKEEYAAATIRRKITSVWQDYLVPNPMPDASGLPKPGRLPCSQAILAANELSVAIHGKSPSKISSPQDLAARMGIDESVAPSTVFRGGGRAAQVHLESFFAQSFSRYAADRSDPSLEVQSNMSPFLHFGQISPVDIALQAIEFWNEAAEGFGRAAPTALAAQYRAASENPLLAYLEQLVVRRELSFNFVARNPQYDEFACLPEWARKTLADHAADPRPETYSIAELETAATGDAYWNAAQREMLATGKMAGYMRMYWGKKILEWSPSPEEAYDRILYLNNKYFIDGRDPNSYAGVAWIFGKHDRPWTPRAIFGTVRYMNARGLERKFDIRSYARRWSGEPNLGF